MDVDWDEQKRATNLAKHGLDFADVANLDWAAALVEADTRFDYGEVRLIALAPLLHEPDRLLSVVFVIERRSVRVISFRRASNREINHYEQKNPAKYR